MNPIFSAFARGISKQLPLCGFGEWCCANYVCVICRAAASKNAKPAQLYPFAGSAQASARISI